VYASPLERARETAAPLARALGVRVRTERGLLELDIGDWTGVSLKRAALRREWGAVQRWPSGFAFPGGESFTELVARTQDAIGRLVRAHPGQAIVALSHADPIRAIVASAAGVPLDLFQRITISTCSISAVRYGLEGPRVICVNASARGLVHG
ncbi:MAG: histidine phosphatase family protein, partial [Acidimicrobiales bacterium]